MLAEPRKRQKWSINPRGNDWSNDESKFGQKLMEKMGWEKGKGLGAKEDGRTEHVKVAFKGDNKGVGCSVNHADNWIAHQDDFNSLLSNLSACHSAPTSACASGDESETFSKVQSLELKSKASKGRVHYMKFTKGKDLSRYGETDMDCIFGKRKSKSATNSPLVQSEVNSDVEDGKPSCSESDKVESTEHSFGVQTTTSSSSIQEYFARKMAELKNARQQQENKIEGTNVENPEGDSLTPVNEEKSVDQGDSVVESVGDLKDGSLTKKKKKKKAKKGEDEERYTYQESHLSGDDQNHQLNENDDVPSICSDPDLWKPFKKKSRKDKCKRDIDEDSSVDSSIMTKCKKRKLAEEDDVIQSDTPDSKAGLEAKSKKKKKKKNKEGKSEDNVTDGEVCTAQQNEQVKEVETVSGDENENSVRKKKKKKKKNKEKEKEEEEMDDEIHSSQIESAGGTGIDNQEEIGKKKKKKDKRKDKKMHDEIHSSQSESAEETGIENQEEINKKEKKKDNRKNEATPSNSEEAEAEKKEEVSLSSINFGFPNSNIGSIKGYGGGINIGYR